jgi:type II secretory pathway pseudopilin PulG
MRSTEPERVRAEFLLMLLVAVAIVGILAGILVPVLANKLDDAQMRSEAEALRSLRGDFEATYDSVDFNGQNESSIDGDGLPAGTTFTTFDSGTGIGARIFSPAVVVDPAGWVTKLAIKRGVSSYVIGAAYTALSQNQYTAIAFNAYGVQRCLVIGPTGESGQQRYLLISLMVPLTGRWSSPRRIPPRHLTRSGTRAGNRPSPGRRPFGPRCSPPTNTPSGTQPPRTTGPMPRGCLCSASFSPNTR